MATRRERVVLDLDDNFSAGIARAGAETALLDKRIHSLSRQAVQSRTATRGLGDDMDQMGRRADRAGAQIDRLSGRMRIYRDLALVFNPVAGPLGAVGATALGGLAAQFGFATLGAGTAVAAFQGVGEALKAMNKAAVEPTEANLAKARATMEQLSPAAREFTRELSAMGPKLKALRDTAAAGMFPGFTEGLDALDSLLPKIQRIMGAVSGELGDIGAATGKSLASARWADFFDFLATDAPSALREMAQAAGNTGHAMAEMWMAFDPLNDDFSRWLVDSTASLDEWATSLEQTQGFANFMDYMAKTGPQVADTFGALANMMVQIVQASAPLGGPVLKGIEAVADAISAIANSDIGTPILTAIAALTLYNRTLGITAALMRSPALARLSTTVGAQRGAVSTLARDWRAYNGVVQTAQGRAQSSATAMMAHSAAATRLNSTLRQTAATAGKTGAMVGGLALVTTGAADKFHLTNTASLALMGTLAGPWGAAIGGAVGATLDLSHANDDLKDSVAAARAAMKSGDVDAMAASYDRLSKSIAETRDVGSHFDPRDTWNRIEGFTGAATGRLGAAEKDLASAGGALNGAASFAAAQQMAAGFKLTASAASMATRTVEGFSTAIARLNGAIGQKSNLLAYREALLSASEALKANGRTLNMNTAAGQANRRALLNMAGAAVNAAKDMAPLKGARYLQGARQDFIRTATAMGMPRAQARALARELLQVDRSDARPTIKLTGAEAAIADARRVAAAIAAVRSKSVTIETIERRRSAGNINIPIARADGGLITGPGGPRDDVIPALLSNGEFVVNAAATQRNLSLLHEINAQKFADGGLVKRFANGGHVRGGDSGIVRNLHGLAAAVERSKKAIESETKKRDDLISGRDEVASGVSGGLMRDPFEKGHPSYLRLMTPEQRQKSLTESVFSTLKEDIASARTMQTLLKTLKGKGLDGQAYAALAGTNDVDRMQAFANMGTADLKSYSALYDQRTALANATGAYAGNAAFGADLSSANKHLATLVQQNKELNQRIARLEKQKRAINVHGAKDPEKTAREVSRRQRFAG